MIYIIMYLGAIVAANLVVARFGPTSTIINAFLFFIDYRTDRVIDWAYWPLIGWGIGLLFHGLNIFIFGEGSAWKESMIRREMDRETNREMSGDKSGGTPGETPDARSGEPAGRE